MIVDPHTHVCPASPCSVMSPEELIEAALASGLDAVAVTDHGTMESAHHVLGRGRDAGLLVFMGMEVHTRQGDILVFGVGEDVAACDDACELVDLVHGLGGASVAAHPYRGGHGFGAFMRGSTPDDVLVSVSAIETLNGSDSAHARDLALFAANRLGKPTFGGSDAHDANDVGRCVTVFERSVRTQEAFVAELRAGRVRAASRAEVGLEGRMS